MQVSVVPRHNKRMRSSEYCTALAGERKMHSRARNGGSRGRNRRNGVELCFLGESTTPPLYLRGRRYPFERFEPKYLLLMHALPEPNLQCMMRPYYYHLGGGQERHVGNRKSYYQHWEGGGLDPQVREVT